MFFRIATFAFSAALFCTPTSAFASHGGHGGGGHAGGHVGGHGGHYGGSYHHGGYHGHSGHYGYHNHHGYYPYYGGYYGGYGYGLGRGYGNFGYYGYPSYGYNNYGYNNYVYPASGYGTYYYPQQALTTPGMQGQYVVPSGGIMTPVTPTVAAPATVTVIVPAGAQVWFNGTEDTTSGPNRVFTSSVLQPGQTAVLSIKTLVNGSATEMQLPITTGDKMSVDLSR